MECFEDNKLTWANLNEQRLKLKYLYLSYTECICFADAEMEKSILLATPI